MTGVCVCVRRAERAVTNSHTHTSSLSQQGESLTVGNFVCLSVGKQKQEKAAEKKTLKEGHGLTVTMLETNTHRCKLRRGMQLMLTAG